MKIHSDDKFWSLVEKTDSCWLWKGPIQHPSKSSVGGYGRFGRKYAHRYSYELANGPIPRGLEPDHLCRNRACVNPGHMEAVTHLENVRRGALANRPTCPKGHAYDARKEHGRFRSCRTCTRSRERGYYDAHKDVIALQRKTRRLANRDEVNRKQQDYRKRRAGLC